MKMYPWKCLPEVLWRVEYTIVWLALSWWNALVPLVLANSTFLHWGYATTGEDHRLNHSSLCLLVDFVLKLFMTVQQCCKRACKWHKAAWRVYVCHFRCNSQHLSSKFVISVFHPLQMALVIRICCPCVFATRNISPSVPTLLQWSRQESLYCCFLK